MAMNQEAHATEGRQARSTNKGKDCAKVVFDTWQEDFRHEPLFDEPRDARARFVAAVTAFA